MSNRITILISALMLSTSIGCEREGPAEQAGEKIDQAVEETHQRVEKATEEAGQILEEAGDRVRQETAQ